MIKTAALVGQGGRPISAAQVSRDRKGETAQLWLWRYPIVRKGRLLQKKLSAGAGEYLPGTPRALRWNECNKILIYFKNFQG